MIKSLFAASALALTCAATFAQAQEAAPAAVQETSVDPAREAAAGAVVDHIFPAGTYARMMDGTFQAMMKSAMNGAGDMPLRDMAAISGASQAELEKLGSATLNQIMEIYDPAFKQRMSLMMDTMSVELGKMMTTFEPAMREGLTQAYAKRFTTEQMADLNRFFETPSGKAYAKDSMLIFMDPAVMERMQKAMPELMKQMPSMIGAMEKASASLPKPRSYKDLTQPERAKLAKLLGITEAQLARQQRK